MAPTKQLDIVSGSLSVKTDEPVASAGSKPGPRPCVKKTTKAAFDTAASHGLSSSHQYEKVAVLLIHWEGHLDPGMNCGPEVAELGKVFRDDYHYQTTLLPLHDNRSPQLQLQGGIDNWIAEHDGPHQNHLLIVYYSGHGQDYSNTFNITGQRDPGLPRTSDVFTAKADWIKATKSFKTDTRADVLMIVDSCFAGSIMDKGGGCDARLVQALLAAGRNGLALPPGPGSFTNAMIDVLKTSLQRGRADSSQYLDTFELRTEIDKRQKKHVVLANLLGSHRIIKLMPLPQHGTTLSPSSNATDAISEQSKALQLAEYRRRTAPFFPTHLLSPEASAITLRFSFSKANAITEQSASELGRELSHLAREKLGNFGIRGIEMTEQIKVDPPRKYSGVGQIALMYCALRRAEGLWRQRIIQSKKSGTKRGFIAEYEARADSLSPSGNETSERPTQRIRL